MTTAVAPEADRLLEAMVAAGRVLLTGPVQPDGDSIGACLALRCLLRSRGVDADVAGRASYRYAWMPGAASMIADEDLETDYRAVVVVDGDRHRLTDPAARAFRAARVKGIVDHHASTRPDGYTHAWLEPGASSTCEMLYGALRSWGHVLDSELGALLYTGAIFDTGGFRYANTTPATHQMAAHLLKTGFCHAEICSRVLQERRVSGLRLAGHVFSNATVRQDGTLVIGRIPLAVAQRFGQTDGDLEGIVDALLHVVGVEVAVLLIERADGTVKYSLRSRGQVDVAAVAGRLTSSGGGHCKAAGACVSCTLDEAEVRVARVLDEPAADADPRC